MTAPTGPVLAVSATVMSSDYHFNKPMNVAVSSNKQSSSRIPDSLKYIFIQSAQGNEDIVPAPADGAAFKVFERDGDRPYNAFNSIQSKQPEPLKSEGKRIHAKSRPKLSSEGRVERPKLMKQQGDVYVEVDPNKPKQESAEPKQELDESKLSNHTAVCGNKSKNTPKDVDEPKRVLRRNQSSSSRRSRFSSHRRLSTGSISSKNTSKDGGGAKSQPRGFLSSWSNHGDRSGRSRGTKRQNKLQQEKERLPVIISTAEISEENTPENDAPVEEGLPKCSSSFKASRERKLISDDEASHCSTLSKRSSHSRKHRSAEGNGEKDGDDELKSSSCHSTSSYPSQRSPQIFIDVMLRTRGYPIETFRTMETSYYNAPTELQKSSYHARLQEMIRSSQEQKLREIMVCGISTNPCNLHGESLLHTACRNGYDGAVRVMLECGASVQVSDDSGRTPLHAAFFGTTPSYDIVEMIVIRDRNLLYLKDNCGATPLSYIPKDHWGMWIDFFYARRDVFWPRRNKRFDAMAEGSRSGVCSPKMHEQPNSAPLPDPANALSLELASMVAAGKLSPDEAHFISSGGDDDDEDGDSTTCSGSGYTSTYGSICRSGCGADSVLSCDDDYCDDDDDDNEDDVDNENNVDDDDDAVDNLSAVTDLTGDSFAWP